MKRIAFLLAASIIGATGFAQETYSLKQAIDYSLKNHGSNVIYKNEIQKVKLQSKEALSAYLPQVNANATFDDNLQRQTTILPGAMFGKTEDIAVQMGNKYNSTATIQLDQTIYDQAMIYGIKAGVPAKKIAELKQAKNNEELIYGTASAYSQILLLKEQQKLITANQDQYQQLYDITKFRFDKGVAKKVDMDRVVVQLNNIKAQQKQIQADIEVAYNSLKNAMGLPLNATLQIEDSLNYEKYMQSAYDNLHVQDLIDYQLQDQSIALQELDVKRKQAASLPTLSGYARYGQQGFGNTVGDATSDWHTFSAVGLKLNVPLFSGQRRQAQLQQSKLELQNAKQNQELNEAGLQLQFQNAARQLQENMTTLSANRSNMNLAKTVYETSQFEYSKGVSSIADLLNADFSYRQAQANYMTSLLNLVSNRLEYERAKGTVTQFVNQL
ncbi:TolC family protein [Polluticoccus soli]|uniref:TolC family protein n=1 Tax=Polluticoccus soli TaxID=3034150 RepID=UPI0023E2A51D|nr:TolC family protein [Flavipsychrobacter sp. JY13-12]